MTLIPVEDLTGSNKSPGPPQDANSQNTKSTENTGVILGENDQLQASSALHLRRDGLRLSYTPKDFFAVASITFLILRRDRSGARQYCQEIGQRKIAIGPPFIYFCRVINTTTRRYQIRGLISEERNTTQTNLVFEPKAFIVSS